MAARSGLLPVLLGGLMAVAAQAQQAAPQAPATAPHRLTVPSGFKLIEAESHRIIAEAADEAWIRDALKTMTPTTQPSTMPSDLLTRLATSKAELVRRLSSDLAMPDPAPVEKLLTDKIEPALHKLESLNPPLVYLVTTSDRLKEIVKAGWSDPQFYYNRAADDVFYQPAQIAFDQENGDAIVPSLYEVADIPQQRGEKLVNAIHNTEGSLGNSLMHYGINVVFGQVVNFIGNDVFAPMKLHPDEEWFGTGVANVLALRYSTEVSGMLLNEQLDIASAPSNGNPLQNLALDLSNPMNVDSIRPEAMPAYADLFRSRSVRAVRKLIEQGGDGAIGKVMMALRKGIPVDGAGLVEVIKATTNVDLGAELKNTR
jgi:hypothetical protein